MSDTSAMAGHFKTAWKNADEHAREFLAGEPLDGLLANADREITALRAEVATWKRRCAGETNAWVAATKRADAAEAERDAALEAARNYRTDSDQAQKIATDMGLLARDLDRESGTISPHVIASDIRDILDGHPERVAWTNEEKPTMIMSGILSVEGFTPTSSWEELKAASDDET